MIQELLIPLIFAWNPQPVDSFKVWRGTEIIATVTTNRAVLKLPLGDSTLTVTAIRNGVQSAHSEPFHIHIVEPRLSIQGSADLIDWHFPTLGDTFFRIKKEY